ncbi:hypothetical protein A3K63_02895 [Candidatus Micrarchaeota archaeon RBG_16_49_10]|nr:MAG: hypothetical protein A3K63_02895 [Candidatus Micrarchaeota archaeon RBG_16_49_10]
MSKGISAIIATILLLLITIALAGTAYVFISGMLAARTTYTIDIESPECIKTGAIYNVTFALRNDGTESVTTSSIVVRDGVTTLNMAYGTATLTAKTVTTATSTSTLTAGSHKVSVTGQSNSESFTVYCP